MAPNPQDALAVLLRLKAQNPTEDDLSYTRTLPGGETVNDWGNRNTDFGREQRSEADGLIAADKEREQKRQDSFMAVHDANLPEMRAYSDRQLADKEALASAPARAAAAGSLAVEQEKNRGDQALKAQQTDFTKEMLGIGSAGTGGGSLTGGAAPGTPGSLKPAINANGGVSFTQNQMPALVQRARDQLSDAAIKTDHAIAQMERLYPGISTEAAHADTGNQSTGWGAFLTGNAPKYGGVGDMASALNERAKYGLGVGTPFADLAQSASFGNIEQMAGQLPGVRGLATITPLFKEHQSRWGYETPLATAQRLVHMRSLMASTLKNIDGGDGTVDGPPIDTTDLGADWGAR